MRSGEEYPNLWIEARSARPASRPRSQPSTVFSPISTCASRPFLIAVLVNLSWPSFLAIFLADRRRHVANSQTSWLLDQPLLSCRARAHGGQGRKRAADSTPGHYTLSTRLSRLLFGTGTNPTSLLSVMIHYTFIHMYIHNAFKIG